MSEINLLPWRQTQRARHQKRLRYVLLAVLLTLSGVLLFMHEHFTHRTHHRLKTIIVDTVKTVTAKIGEESLESLHFIGSLSDATHTWALLSHSKGLVSTVTTGDYLGKEHGRVVHIHSDVMDIETIERSEDGIKKKIIQLRLPLTGDHLV